MQYQYGAYYAMEEGTMALLSGLLSGIPSVAISMLTYVFSSLALYTIARRRCIHNPWLSWVPVANVWILGSLSDQYRYVVHGEDKSKRKVLLTLNIITAVLSLAVITASVWLVVRIVTGVISQNMESLLAGMTAPLTLTGMLCLPLLGVAVALAIVRFMALYDVYTSCDPQNNVLFVVLSILIPVTEPIFLFICRQKDGGMPPRRPEYAYMPPRQDWQPPQPPQQPWNGEQTDRL